MSDDLNAELTACISELRRKGNAGTAGCLARAVERIRKLEGMIATLPTMNDGSPILPGVNLFAVMREDEISPHYKVIECGFVQLHESEGVVRDGDGEEYYVDYGEIYSTREAADVAAAALAGDAGEGK